MFVISDGNLGRSRKFVEKPQNLLETLKPLVLKRQTPWGLKEPGRAGQ
jgi:hypothetical protein